jgi:hypothetical protein
VTRRASRTFAGVARTSADGSRCPNVPMSGRHLVVGVQAVDVDQRDRRAEGLDLRCQVVDERPHRSVQAAGPVGGVDPVGPVGGHGHRGSRHIGHSGGPLGRSIRPVDRKPDRSYHGTFSGLLDSR